MISSLSVGAVGAAFIAAVISLIGLIVAKEQKISDFRQSWIDSLRIEITNYLTNINAISDALNVVYANQAEKVKALSQLYSNLNQAHFMITLRLNPDEKYSSEVLSCMRDFTELAGDEVSLTDLSIRKELEGRFLIAAKNLLKNEWYRVKKGEPTFIVAKYTTILIVTLALVLVGWDYFKPAAAEEACWLDDSSLGFLRLFLRRIVCIPLTPSNPTQWGF
ncbi:hypothetical protein [Sinorhizobium fredii]